MTLEARESGSARTTVTHVLEPIYIPRALNTGTYIPQGDLFFFFGPAQKLVLATANTGKTRERFWKKIQVNGPEGLKLARKNSLAVSVACMATY